MQRQDQDVKQSWDASFCVVALLVLASKTVKEKHDRRWRINFNLIECNVFLKLFKIFLLKLAFVDEQDGKSDNFIL